MAICQDIPLSLQGRSNTRSFGVGSRGMRAQGVDQFAGLRQH